MSKPIEIGFILFLDLSLRHNFLGCLFSKSSSFPEMENDQLTEKQTDVAVVIFNIFLVLYVHL